MRDSEGMMTHLRNEYAPFFVEKPFPAAEANAFLEQHCPPYSHQFARPPDVGDYVTFIKRVKHSQPGPDGVPYEAWDMPDDSGALTLYNIGDSFHDNSPPPITFNESATLFMKKGEEEEDNVEVIREPFATRPIGMKNTDNKIVAGTHVSMYRRDMQLSTHPSQRGVVPGRQLTRNVFDLDSAGRIAAMRTIAHNERGAAHLGDSRFHIALLAMFDFASAFPSIFHKWNFAVLFARGFPIGFINFVSCLY